MDEIQPRYNDSPCWKAILNHRQQIEKCADLMGNKVVIWRGRSKIPSNANAGDTIKEHYPKDMLAKSIWSTRLPKSSALLWCLKGKKLPTRDHLIRRRANDKSECVLWRWRRATTSSMLAGSRVGFLRDGGVVKMQTAVNF